MDGTKQIRHNWCLEFCWHDTISLLRTTKLEAALQDVTSKVRETPQYVKDTFARGGPLGQKGMCWQTNMMAVILLGQERPALRYALGTVTHKNQPTVGHAFLEENGVFYDPVLEPQGLIAGSIYHLFKMMDRAEVIQRIDKFHGKGSFDAMSHGRMAWGLIMASDTGVVFDE